MTTGRSGIVITICSYPLKPHSREEAMIPKGQPHGGPQNQRSRFSSHLRTALGDLKVKSPPLVRT